MTISISLASPASYSQPVLIGPIRNSSSTEEEMTFSCRSSNGYPKPNVYWINKTDNSHLPPSELKITSDTDGTYNVFSTLKVKATSNMQIECSVENKILRENLSANCKSLHDPSCFLGSRYINQRVSVDTHEWGAHVNSVVSQKRGEEGSFCFKLVMLSHGLYVYFWLPPYWSEHPIKRITASSTEKLLCLRQSLGFVTLWFLGYSYSSNSEFHDFQTAV